MPPANAVDDETLLEALDELAEAGERDKLNGGVPPETVAEEVGISASRASERLATLLSDGDVVRVWGADPETYRCRESYLPPGHPDTDPPIL